MAKAEAGAYIGFEKGHRLAVRETPDEIRQALIDLDASLAMPVLVLTRRDGNQVLVNPRLVTKISLPEKRGGAGFV
jgi:hypothetical protein